MADLAEDAEQQMKQAAEKVVTRVANGMFEAAIKLAKDVTQAPFKAVSALYQSVSNQIHKSHSSGQLSLKAFGEAAQGKRELVNIDDAKVSKELGRELDKHGVKWSVEKGADGSQTFHVQGKDAELVQHALGVAAARVDEKILRNAPELQVDPMQQHTEQTLTTQLPAQHEAQQVQDAPTQVIDVPEQSQHAPDHIAPHGTDELRDNLPTQGAVDRDYGGRTSQQEPTAPRELRDPKQSPLDSTRSKVKGEITTRVEQQKQQRTQKSTKRERSQQLSQNDIQTPKATRR